MTMIPHSFGRDWQKGIGEKSKEMGIIYLSNHLTNFLL